MTAGPHPTPRQRPVAPVFVWLGAALLLALGPAGSVRAEEEAAPPARKPAAPGKPANPLVIGTAPLPEDPVVDGDTLRVADGGPTVRIRGVDTEETFKSDKDREAAAADFRAYARAKRGESKRPVKYGTPAGEAAKAFLAKLLEGAKSVRLERDRVGGAEKGRYGRRLAHVFVGTAAGEVLLSEALIRAGHSPVFVKYGRSERFHARLLAAMEEARKAKRGIWDPDGPDRYPDYDERTAWWQLRSGQIERWKQHAGKPDHVTLGEPGAAGKLEKLVGKEAVVFGSLDRELDVKAGDKHILLLSHLPRAGFALVFFDEAVYEALDMDAVSSLYVTVRGKVSLYRGKPQIVVEKAEQVSTK